MNILPQDTFLGKLEMLKIYEYYDKPVLFACRSAAKMTYLVVLLDEVVHSSTWLYVALSIQRFEEIRTGHIDLYRAFKEAEDEIVYEVSIFSTPHPPQIRVLPTSALSETQLPERGEFLEIPTTDDEKEALG